jgi:hypothetical protein
VCIQGVFADFFTVAVRTGGAGMGGVSLLLIERGDPGLKTTQMQCQGVWPSGSKCRAASRILHEIQLQLQRAPFALILLVALISHLSVLCVCVSVSPFPLCCVSDVHHIRRRESSGGESHRK